jgi:serine/threonine protein kinase
MAPTTCPPTLIADGPAEIPLEWARQRRVDGGRLVLLDLLGEGGMASVVRAWDHQQGSWRAVKLLSPALASHAAVRARFRREAQVLRELRHPGLVAVHNEGQDEGVYWIEMELVDGCSLMRSAQLVPNLPVAAAVGAGVELCDALAAAHAAGAVHRDVKPANVLVGSDGRCRLADFGIASWADANMRLTRTGRLMGSAGFMAPEQVSDASRVDHRADIWSLGVTLCAVIAGGHEGDVDQLIHRVVDRVPERLGMALVRATTTDPAHRTPTMAQLGLALRRSLDELMPASPTALHVPLPPLPLALDWR